MDAKLLVIFMAIHLSICTVFVLTGLKDMKKRLCLLVPVFFLPLLGIVSLLIMYGLTKIRKDLNYDLDELSLPTTGMEYVSQVNKETDINVIPVEEALLLNRNDIKRSMVMEAAKRDPQGYLKHLKKALVSDDSETAHYAASSIIDLKRMYEQKLANTLKEYQNNPDVIQTRKAYIAALDAIIKAGLTVDSIQQQHVQTITQMIIDIIRLNQKPTEEYYQMLLNYLLVQEEYDQALGWCQEYEKAYPISDKPLYMKLKIAYATKCEELFKQTMDRAQNANFPITQNTLKVMQYWDEGNSI